jgi:chromosome segregation ATPase
MTNQNKNEVKWREEFERELLSNSYSSNSDLAKEESGEYESGSIQSIWLWFLDGCRKRQVEVDELTWLCENLSSDLKDRNQEISNLKTLIDENIKDISALEGFMNSKNDAIKSLEQENDRLTNRNNQLEDFCQEFVYGEENPEYYKTMGEKLKDREEMIREAILWIVRYYESKSPLINEWNFIRKWLEKAKRLTGGAK